MNRSIKSFLLVIVALLFVNIPELKSQSLVDYRWTIIDAKGDATGRHENAFVEFDGNGADNNGNNMDVQTGLIWKDDGTHQDIQIIIVIR